MQATVEIEKLVYGGEGLARLDGQIVFVPFVLPGERVSVAIDRVNAGLLRGASPQIVETAPRRTTPGCEYFKKCGGCHYQHAEYAFQLELKRAILAETLQRLGGIRFEGEIRIVSGEPWHYRNRIQLHFRNGQAGFHKAGSHDLCAIDHCPISSPMLNQVIAKLRAAAKEPEWPDFLRSLEIFTNETDVQLNVVESIRPVAARFFHWCGTFVSLARGAIEYAAAGHMFRIGPASFFQVNRFLMDALIGEVMSEAAGSHAVDLYAGVGLFTLPLGSLFERVDAVERGGAASRDLEWNANQSANIRAVKASAEDFLRSLSDTPDWIVADPPRAGLGRDVMSELLRLKPPRITLVSCDPSTLARDLRKLISDYRMDGLTLIDLFPQTYHFETVARLVRS